VRSKLSEIDIWIEALPKSTEKKDVGAMRPERSARIVIRSDTPSRCFCVSANPDANRAQGPIGDLMRAFLATS
jgi:hypothetical protein